MVISICVLLYLIAVDVLYHFFSIHFFRSPCRVRLTRRPWLFTRNRQFFAIRHTMYTYGVWRDDLIRFLRARTSTHTSTHIHRHQGIWCANLFAHDFIRFDGFTESGRSINLNTNNNWLLCSHYTRHSHSEICGPTPNTMMSCRGRVDETKTNAKEWQRKKEKKKKQNRKSSPL